MKDSEAGESRTLREIELEVEGEMREWGRKRLQEKLQQEADRQGRVFPPPPASDAARAGADDGAANERGRD